MSVERPLVLLSLLALIPLALLWRLTFLRGRRSLLALGGRWRFDALADVYLFKSFFSLLFLALFVVSAVMSLAGFRWGQKLVEERRTGQEVVILLDVSHSMLARDVAPSRLERSLQVARSVVEQSAQATFSVVVFKGDAVHLIPLTDDRYALDLFLRRAGTELLTSPGSDLEKGIDAAIAAFSDHPGRYRAILLFSDGESLSGNPVAAAGRAGRQGIPVFVASAGTEAGARIVLPGGEPVRDEEGRPVITRLDSDALERVAAVSGGTVVSLNAENPGKKLLQAVQGLQQEGVTLGFRREAREQDRLFVVLAAVFVCLYVLMRAVRWRNTF